MKALIIIAHGSRKAESNNEVVCLAEDLESSGQSGFDLVTCAFNQFGTPTTVNMIDRLAEAGFTDITVLPYFIASGSHVTSDIPETVRVASVKYPAVSFRITPHFGAFRGIKELIIRELAETYTDLQR